MFRTCTGKKQLANITTTATSILAAFRRARNCPIVLLFAAGPEDRKSKIVNTFGLKFARVVWYISCTSDSIQVDMIGMVY